ncbi:MAG: carbohydrate porin [Asticcacaulis sp.]|nr:carbohydrate porin [Asticcacaulis sp.]
MSSLRPHRQSSAIGFYGFIALLIAAAVISQKARAGEIETGAVLTTEVDSLVSGGLDVGSSGLSNLDLTAHWQNDSGWEAFGYVLGDFGDDFSANRVGDVQVTSNIDCPDGWRLFEAYGKKTFGEDRGYVMAGLINLNGIFDVQDNATVFLNASHGIGVDYSQTGPSIFPTTGLGLVGQWHFTSRQTFRAGVFDGVPGDPYDNTKFVYIKLSEEEGSHLVGEYQYDFTGGFVKLGAWKNTATLDRLDGTGTSGNNGGTYAQAGFTLTGNDDHGLKGWVRAGLANDQLMAIADYVGGGLVYTGPIRGHDSDQLGFAIAAAHFGAPYQASTGETLRREITYELTYRWDIRDGLSIQPDLQYVQNPYGRTDTDDAVVVGLRLKTDLMAWR